MRYSDVNEGIKQGNLDSINEQIDEFQERLFNKLYPSLKYNRFIQVDPSGTDVRNIDSRSIDIFTDDGGKEWTAHQVHDSLSKKNATITITDELKAFDVTMNRLKLIPKSVVTRQSRCKGNGSSTLVCDNVIKLALINGVNVKGHLSILTTPNMTNALAVMGREDVSFDGLTLEHVYVTFCWTVQEMLSQNPHLAIDVFKELRRK